MQIGISLSLTGIRGAARGPRILLSAASRAEDAEVNDTIGVVSVVNGSGPYAFTIIDDPDSKFVIESDSDELRLAATLDYETKTSHSVTIQASNGVDDPISRVFTIQVIDVEPEFPVNTTGASEYPILFA